MRQAYNVGNASAGGGTGLLTGLSAWWTFDEASGAGITYGDL